MKKQRKFRLATVLRVAKLEEEAQQRATAAAKRVAEAADVERAARQVAYDARDEFAGPLGRDAFEQQMTTGHLRADALHVATVETLDARDRLELAREDLMARARRTKTLEDLEERHNVAYAIAAARAAQRSLDDLVRAKRAL